MNKFKKIVSLKTLVSNQKTIFLVKIDKIIKLHGLKSYDFM